MGTHFSFIFEGYNPYSGGFKTFIFHGFGAQGPTGCLKMIINPPTNFLFKIR